jgi:hypothetical protein
MSQLVGDAHKQNQPHNWEKEFPAHSHTLLDTLNGRGGGDNRGRIRAQTVAPAFRLHVTIRWMGE